MIKKSDFIKIHHSIAFLLRIILLLGVLIINIGLHYRNVQFWTIIWDIQYNNNNLFLFFSKFLKMIQIFCCVHLYRHPHWIIWICEEVIHLVHLVDGSVKSPFEMFRSEAYHFVSSLLCTQILIYEFICSKNEQQKHIY